MREAGFYWAKVGYLWEVAYWSGYSWWATCSDKYSDDDYWDEIDERRIVREEVK